MITVNFNPFPTLTKERIILRQNTKEDAKEMFLMRFDPFVMQYINRVLAQSVDDTIKHIEKITGLLQNNEGINWGIYKGNEFFMIS